MLSINDIVEALRNNDPSTAFYYDRSTDSIVSMMILTGILQPVQSSLVDDVFMNEVF